MDEILSKNINDLLSPIKGYQNPDGSKMKVESIPNYINSPFPNDIKTPGKIINDWASFARMSNSETPMNGNRVLSPIVSANPQRVFYGNNGAFSMVQKNLFPELSPCKPYIAQSTPYHKNQSTFDRDMSKEQEQKPNFLFSHCKNLTKAFNSIAYCSKEEDLIDVNESLTHFAKIKAAIYGNSQRKRNLVQSYAKKNSKQLEECDQVHYGQCVSIGQLNFNLLKAFHTINENSMSNEDDDNEDLYGNNEEIKEEDEDMISQGDDVDNKPNIIESSTPQFIIPSNTGNDCQQCKCTKSKCLKLYCECFANGKYCSGCFCNNCFNKEEYEAHRRKAYKRIMSKNPKAILKMKSNKRSWNCKCKNSSCQKNYCDCFQNGKFCSSKCKCFDCRNKPPAKRSRGYVRKQHKKTVLAAQVNLIRPRHVEHNHSHNHKKKKVAAKEEITMPVVSHYDAMYTPQKKNYRTVKSEIKNSISTAAYTELTMSIDNKPKRRKSQRNGNNCIDNSQAHASVCKKLEMKDGNGNHGLFQ